jgi:eukaryotic-like serine/threonine-protein kinase
LQERAVSEAAETIGNYRLLKLMGTGQTSQVYEVVENSSGRHFAMKLLLPEKIDNPQCRAFLLHEAEVGLTLAHENCIRITHVSRDPKNPYFVMEFFPAGSLKVRLMKKETEFLRQNMQDILRQTATALAFMNAKGWVHRDIKPDNVLVNASGSVRVIDFAIAKRIEKPSFFGSLFRRKGTVQGTRSYMSPEQIRGQPLDGRADIYSFGCMCYELIGGRTPFRGSTSQELLTKHITEKPISLQALNPDVTKEFADLALHMLAKKREDRPKDFHEVLMKMRAMRVYKPSDKDKPAKKE